jgi:hypothetical protein
MEKDDRRRFEVMSKLFVSDFTSMGLFLRSFRWLDIPKDARIKVLELYLNERIPAHSLFRHRYHLVPLYGAKSKLIGYTWERRWKTEYDRSLYYRTTYRKGKLNKRVFSTYVFYESVKFGECLQCKFEGTVWNVGQGAFLCEKCYKWTPLENQDKMRRALVKAKRLQAICLEEKAEMDKLYEELKD